MLNSSIRTATLATSRSTIPTANAIGGGRTAVRRVARVRVVKRYQTTGAGPHPGPSTGSSSAGTHLAAGVAGGAAVLLGAYGYYHFSGAKKAVDASKAAHAYYQQTKATIVEKAPKSPNEAMQFLRGVAKSYAGIIPGASSYVDSTFDSLDELHDTHGEELNKILQDAYNDVRDVLKDVKDQEGIDAEKASKLISILGKHVSELNELAKKAGSDAFTKLEEKYPMVAQTIGSSYSDLKSLAQRGGPEAKKLIDESISQVQDMLKNSKNPQDAWMKARELVQGRSQQLKEMVWDKAAEEAKEHPELAKLLKENREAFMQQGVSIRSLKEVLEQVKTAGKGGALNQGKISELSDFMQSKAKETQAKGWENLQEWVKSVPGGDEALKKMSDVDLQSLMELSKNKTGDAKQLAEETYRDLLNVLQEKAGKAKKLAKEGADEAKSKSS